MTEYNGYKNYETWNVALWVSNDEGLYNFAKSCRNYRNFANNLREIGVSETPDNVAYNDSGLDTDTLDELIDDL